MGAGAIGLGLDAATSLGQSIYGIYQLLHGSKGLRDLKRPVYEIDPNIKYNQQLAGQIASEGIPDSAKNFYADSIDRGLGSTIASAEKTGQGLSAINNAYGSSNDAFRQLLAADAQQKLQNQQILMGANKDLAQENLRAFDYNKNQPYLQDYSKFTQQTNSGVQNIFGGLKGAGSDLTGGAGGGGNTDFNKLFQQYMQQYGGGDYSGSISTGNIG